MIEGDTNLMRSAGPGHVRLVDQAAKVRPNRTLRPALVTFFGCDVTLTPISHQHASQTGRRMGCQDGFSSPEATRQKYFRNVNRPYCKLTEYGAA